MSNVQVTGLTSIKAKFVGKSGRIMLDVTNSKQEIIPIEIKLLEGWKAEGLYFAFNQVRYTVPDACKVHISSFSISN